MRLRDDWRSPGLRAAAAKSAFKDGSFGDVIVVESVADVEMPLNWADRSEYWDRRREA